MCGVVNEIAAKSQINTVYIYICNHSQVIQCSTSKIYITALSLLVSQNLKLECKDNEKLMFELQVHVHVHVG